jgi:hypothetical protein
MGLPKGGISHTLFLVRVASPGVWATMAGEAGEACENFLGAVHPRISSTDRLTKHSSLVAMAKSGYRRACIVAGDGRERYIIPVAGVCRGSLLFIRSALFSRPILLQPAQQESSRSAVNPATAAHRYYYYCHDSYVQSVTEPQISSQNATLPKSDTPPRIADSLLLQKPCSNGMF